MSRIKAYLNEQCLHFLRISDINVVNVKFILFSELYNSQNNIVSRMMLIVNVNKKKIRVNINFCMFTAAHYMFVSICTTLQNTITLTNTVCNDYCSEFVSHDERVI